MGRLRRPTCGRYALNIGVTMREESKLSNLRSFWLSILIPLIASLLIAIIIATNSNLGFNFSYKGFNEALVIFKVPLAVLALIFPSVALVATEHRSSQSAEMMRRNNTQTSFSNYYTHREEFFKVLSKLEEELAVQFHDANGLYRTLFPQNSVETLELRSREEGSEKSALEFHVATYEKLMESIRTPNVNLRQVQNFYLEFYMLACSLGFTIKDGHTIDWPIYWGIDKAQGWVVAYESNNPLKQSWITSQVLKRLCDFCHIDRNLHLIAFTPYQEFKDIAEEAFNPTSA